MEAGSFCGSVFLLFLNVQFGAMHEEVSEIWMPVYTDQNLS